MATDRRRLPCAFPTSIATLLLLGLGAASAQTQLDALRRAALVDAGSAARGKLLYSAETSRCAACHKLDGKGGELGPDLSQIGV